MSPRDDASAEVVPFGKYKGRPAETLLTDREYRDWLTSQPWFRDKFQNIYNLVINYGGPPQDSPEHNALQMEFLDHGTCLRAARLLGLMTLSQLWTNPVFASEWQPHEAWVQRFDSGPYIDDLRFEQSGWDVVFTARAAVQVKPDPSRWPACICTCDHTACPEREGWQCHHHYHVDGAGRRITHCVDSCWHADRTRKAWLDETWGHGDVSRRVCHLEVKPLLGDDYPSVLRQVLKYPLLDSYCSARCVIARITQFETVTFEQVHRLFASQDVRLLRFSELTFDDRELTCRCSECQEASSPGTT